MTSVTVVSVPFISYVVELCHLLIDIAYVAVIIGWLRVVCWLRIFCA